MMQMQQQLQLSGSITRLSFVIMVCEWKILHDRFMVVNIIIRKTYYEVLNFWKGFPVFLRAL